jgi:hypothetical protein
MSTLFDIEVALQTQLDNIVGHPDIAWENDETYNPILGQRYWRPTLIPARGSLASFQGLQQYQGLLQVDVFVPLNTGKKQLIEDLDLISQQFLAGSSIYSGDIRLDILDRQPGQAMREQSWYRGYIEIYYMCYAH